MLCQIFAYANMLPHYGDAKTSEEYGRADNSKNEVSGGLERLLFESI